jgi:tRNA U38,U39,U40 pseudouridine synthase TruA
MVGLLVRIGTGDEEAAAAVQALSGDPTVFDRNRAPRAPAHGLWLAGVTYDQ